MKRIAFLLLILASFTLSAQIKVGSLPKTFTGTKHDWIIKNDSANGTGATKICTLGTIDTLLGLQNAVTDSTKQAYYYSYFTVGGQLTVGNLYQTVNKDTTVCLLVLRVVDGTQANGKIFTSDAYGHGSWQYPGAVLVKDTTPSTGNTITATTGYQFLAIHGSGTFTTLTVRLPNSPANGQAFTISSDQIITTLTLTNGTTVTSYTTLAIGTPIRLRYDAANSKWFNN